MEWNGMEWNGMEWNGMEWNGMEWNGMEWKVLLRTASTSILATLAGEALDSSIVSHQVVKGVIL